MALTQQQKQKAGALFLAWILKDPIKNSIAFVETLESVIKPTELEAVYDAVAALDNATADAQKTQIEANKFNKL